MKNSSRRAFFGQAAAAVMLAQDFDFVGWPGQSAARRRQDLAFRVRIEAARREHHRPVAPHPANGDEDLYPNRIASYTKGLPHTLLGEVDAAAWRSLKRALNSGRPDDFEDILLGGRSRLVNPQAGLAFELLGPVCRRTNSV